MDKSIIKQTKKIFPPTEVRNPEGSLRIVSEQKPIKSSQIAQLSMFLGYFGYLDESKALAQAAAFDWLPPGKKERDGVKYDRESDGGGSPPLPVTTVTVKFDGTMSSALVVAGVANAEDVARSLFEEEIDLDTLRVASLADLEEFGIVDEDVFLLLQVVIALKPTMTSGGDALPRV